MVSMLQQPNRGSDPYCAVPTRRFAFFRSLTNFIYNEQTLFLPSRIRNESHFPAFAPTYISVICSGKVLLELPIYAVLV